MANKKKDFNEGRMKDIMSNSEDILNPKKSEKNETNKENKNNLKSKNIDFGPYNDLVYTEDFEKEIRRTYKITKKHINILNLIKMKSENELDLREAVMEAIELLWKVKFETEAKS
jgi:hypothetical protein